MPAVAATLEDKPAPTRIELNGRVPSPTSNICWRTPEVQEKLIEDLKIPSCQLINEAELFRVREFDADTPKVKPGDFDHMPNLEGLGLKNLRELPPVGTFDGLNNLRGLDIWINAKGELTIPKGTFADLGALKELKINDTSRGNREMILVLEHAALDGLNQLEYISLGNIAEISAADLAGLNSIRHIKIHREWLPSEQEQDAPVIPTDLIADLSTVDTLEVNGFQWPTALEMNSLEHACLMEEGGGYSIPHPTVMTVDGKIIQHQGREHRDGELFCIMKIGDEIREVLRPTP